MRCLLMPTLWLTGNMRFCLMSARAKKQAGYSQCNPPFPRYRERSAIKAVDLAQGDQRFVGDATGTNLLRQPHQCSSIEHESEGES